MLVACFPKIHLRGLVWVACLPLLAALAGEKRLKRAFLLGYVCGAVFLRRKLLLVRDRNGILRPLGAGAGRGGVDSFRHH